MKTLQYILVSCLLLMTGMAKAQDSLGVYLQMAARNNPGVKSAFTNYLASLEKVPQAKALPDPNLAFGYFIQAVETRLGPQDARMSIGQMFPWFGTLKTRENVAARKAKNKYQQFMEAKTKLFMEVKKAYYNLYFSHRALAILKKELEIIESLENLSITKAETGSSPVVDILRMNMDKQHVLAQLDNTREEYKARQATLLSLLNPRDDHEIFVPDSLPSGKFEDNSLVIQDSIRQNNPMLKALDEQKKVFDEKAQLAKKLGFPSFTVGVDYIFIGTPQNPMSTSLNNGQDAILFPKIGLSIPLYRQKYQSMEKEAILQEESIGLAIEDKKNMLDARLDVTMSKYLKASRDINLYRSQVKTAFRALDILQESYASTSTGFEEVLRMEKKRLQYTLELEKATVSRAKAIAELEYLMGKTH